MTNSIYYIPVFAFVLQLHLLQIYAIIIGGDSLHGQRHVNQGDGNNNNIHNVFHRSINGNVPLLTNLPRTYPYILEEQGNIQRDFQLMTTIFIDDNDELDSNNNNNHHHTTQNIQDEMQTLTSTLFSSSDDSDGEDNDIDDMNINSLDNTNHSDLDTNDDDDNDDNDDDDDENIPFQRLTTFQRNNGNNLPRDDRNHFLPSAQRSRTEIVRVSMKLRPLLKKDVQQFRISARPLLRQL